VLGRGEIGTYAITSDSTAETFLTAVKGNGHDAIAALEGHSSGQEVAMHVGKLGVPLARTTPFLEATGAELAAIVAGQGGTVATRSDVVEARRTADGVWAARVVNRVTGEVRVMRAAKLVIATGGAITIGITRIATIGIAMPIAGVPACFGTYEKTWSTYSQRHFRLAATSIACSARNRN